MSSFLTTVTFQYFLFLYFWTCNWSDLVLDFLNLNLLCFLPWKLLFLLSKFFFFVLHDSMNNNKNFSLHSFFLSNNPWGDLMQIHIFFLHIVVSIALSKVKGRELIINWTCLLFKLEFPRNGRQFVWRKKITMLDEGLVL